MMTERKWTPGPWKWVEGKGTWRGSIEPDVCDFGDDTQYYPTEGEPPNEANAHLIAAAPDLYDALEALLVTKAPDFIPSRLWDDARAALAKARGEQ